MNALNACLTQLGNWLFAPFHAAPTAGLLFWSAVTGVVMTYVFGKTSNQKALRRSADQVRAQLLAVKLFKDDLTVTMQCQVALLKATGWRLLYSMSPMLVMIVPLLLVLTQLALRYEFRPMLPGEKSILTMQLTPEAWDDYLDVKLEAPSGVVIEAGALHDPKTNSLTWRLRSESDRSASLKWKFGEQTIEKELSMAGNSKAVQSTNPIRPGTNFWDLVFYPGESGLNASSPVKSIAVQYEPRLTPIIGIDIPWWATFFIVSMVVALIAGKVIGVQY